jgi:hypothetical protein
MTGEKTPAYEPASPSDVTVTAYPAPGYRTLTGTANRLRSS